MRNRLKRQSVRSTVEVVALLILFMIGFAETRPAHASTYYYTGPAWDVTQCNLQNWGGGTPTCLGGAVTASVTFSGISTSYTGWVSSANMTEWSINAPGVASLNSGSNYLVAAAFYFNNGEITDWSLRTQDSSMGNPAIGTNWYMGSGNDYAASGNPVSMAGYISPNSNYPGHWDGPKSRGLPLLMSYAPGWGPHDPLAGLTSPPQKPSCCGQISQVGEPIDVATGNMFSQVLDYSTVGQNPLAFIRYYNSDVAQDTLATTLGVNWRHNYDRYLRIVSSTEVDVERQDGKVVTFVDVSGTWTPDSDVDLKLTGSGSSYTLTDANGVAEAYSVSSGVGTLSSITWPNGYTQTLTYSSGKLQSVADSYSRSLGFTYTGSELTGVSTPDAATLTYAYTTVLSKKVLQSVTYNTSPSTNQTYSYSDTNYPYALTGITDENGNSYASWTYDAQGHCTNSQFAGGADEIQVSYNYNGQRTVTGPLGEALTYSFTLSKGIRKVSSIARAAASPVASATRSFTYDGNGYLDTATDWNGNSTHYTNNSHGRPTSITEAYGTGRARTATISYDSNCPWKPEIITKTNLIVTNDWDNTTCDLLMTTYEDDTGGSTDGQTHVWTYTYTSYGLLNTVVRRQGLWRRFEVVA